MPRVWTLNRLRDRLDRVERAKDKAMQAMIVEDEVVYAYPRYAFQDPGQIGSMLDEIALLQQQIADLEGFRRQVLLPAPHMAAIPVPTSHAVPQAPQAKHVAVLSQPAMASESESALDIGFKGLLAALQDTQRRHPDGRVDQHALQSALFDALGAPAFLGAVFDNLRAEMKRIQESGERSGPDALHAALRFSLVGKDAVQSTANEQDRPCQMSDESWPDPSRPGVPPDPHINGWYGVQMGDHPPTTLFWHAATYTWSCSTELTPAALASAGMRFRGKAN